MWRGDEEFSKLKFGRGKVDGSVYSVKGRFF